MERRIVKICSIIEILLAIVIYFSINYSFGHDAIIMSLLERTDFISTLLRLTIFIIPAVHLISGLFGLVFDARYFLIYTSIVQLICSICFLIFLKGKSLYMFWLGITTVFVALIYLVGALLYKENQK